MKRPPIGMVLVGLSALLFVVVLLASVFDNGQQAATAPAATPTPTATPAERRSEKKKAKPKRTSTKRQKLINKAAGFVEANYLHLPKDDTSTRRERIGKFLTAEEIEKLVGLGHLRFSTASEDEHSARHKHPGPKLSTRGQVIASSIQAIPFVKDPTTVVLLMRVRVTTTLPNGKRVAAPAMLDTASEWSKRDSEWFINEFAEGGGTR